jgi:dTDP-4-amino-4,6-dideoxygalactose transaminase
MQYLFHNDLLIHLIENPGSPSDKVLDLCRSGAVQGWVLGSTVPLLVRAAQRSNQQEQAQQILKELLSTLSILTQTADNLLQSIADESADFEVALAISAAKEIAVDGILTLDPKPFADSRFPAGTPEDWEEINTKKSDSVPLLNIPVGYHEILNDIETNMNGVIRSGHFILGPQVEKLESAIANYCGCNYAVGVSSGTDALLLAMMAEGIGPGDEVITTPYTFFATAGCISRLGAKPVFVDIEPSTFNIDPDLIEQKISPKTRAILPVHLYGQCADMDPLIEIAKRHNLVIIEDAAQAIGAEYKFRRAGSFGKYGCFSFFPTKNLGGFGDGGIITVQDEVTRDKLITLRVHGSKPKYYHKYIGGNFRIDALQAAVVLAKLKYLESWTEKRRANAQNYHRLFKASSLSEVISLPEEIFPRHVYNQFIIQVHRNRDDLRTFLGENNIATEVYYPVPLHLQDCYKDFGLQKGSFPNSEQMANETRKSPSSNRNT